MDILNLITNKDRVDFSENFNYKTNFKLDSLFPKEKTDNLKVAISRLVENGTLPVMATIHALDTEAKIGDRTNYRSLELEKLLIKEKINQTERIQALLGNTTDEEAVLNFIYDDMSSLTSRVLTRAELANNQVMSTGKLEINENNYKTTVDYGYSSGNNIALSGWNDTKHDIIGDLETVINKAKSKGKKITRALTSSKIVSYMAKNEGIRSYFEKAAILVTEKTVLRWVYENFGIAFDVNDDLYKEDANATTTHRFYPENKISFFGGEGGIGKGFYTRTPEELANIENQSKGFVTITNWDTPDPVATWTKASAMYIPVIADIDNLFIATLTNTTVSGS